MKRLLTKALDFRRRVSPMVHQPTDLQPKIAVPEALYPYTHLAILASKEGLLIRPHITGSDVDQTECPPCIRVPWGKSIDVEEIQSYQLSEELNWSESVIVYGIVGILELFSCSSINSSFLFPFC